MATNKNAANALMKLKTSKAPNTKTPKKRKVETPIINELKRLARVENFIKSIRPKKPTNNTNKKKAASKFLESAFTPRKNVKK
jgi:hypothetical protein